jgi:hypothetical protein
MVVHEGDRGSLNGLRIVGDIMTLKRSRLAAEHKISHDFVAFYGKGYWRKMKGSARVV